MPNDLFRQLKSLRRAAVDPAASWVADNRSILLSQIKNTLPKSAPAVRRADKVWAGLEIFLPRKIVTAVVRPVAIILIIVMSAGTALAAMARAASNTIPDDTLYPIKRFTEQAQVTVAAMIGDQGAVTKLHVEFAKQRAFETKQLVQIAAVTGAAPAPSIAATVADLKSEMSAVSNNLNDNTSAVAKTVNQNSQEISSVLQDVKNNLILNASNTPAGLNLTRQVSSATSLAKDIGIKAVAVIVNNQAQGDTSVSKDDAKQMVADSLQTVATAAAKSQQVAAGVHTVVEQAKDVIKKSDGKQIPGAITTITTVDNQTVAAVLKTEQVSAQVGQQISEAKALVGQDNLVQAVSKIQQANQATQEAERVSDAAVQKAQQVLPTVAPDSAASSSLLLNLNNVSNGGFMSSTPSIIGQMISPRQ